MEISTQGGPGRTSRADAAADLRGEGRAGATAVDDREADETAGTTIRSRDGTFTLPPGGPSRGMPSRERR